MRPNTVRTVAKERFSYPLRLRFARSAWRDLRSESEAGNLMRLPDARWRTPEIFPQLQAITRSSHRAARTGRTARHAGFSADRGGHQCIGGVALTRIAIDAAGKRAG